MFQELTQHFEALLLDTAKERSKRSGIVDGEIGWVLHERAVMFAEVNKKRQEQGKNEAEMEKFLLWEACCVGHVDYAHKFAMRCAELVLE